MINFRHIACLFLVLFITACGSDSSGRKEAGSKSPTIKLQSAYLNLTFDRPVLFLQEPNNNSRWYVVEQGGKIFWFDAIDKNTMVKNTYLDFSNIVDVSGEGGLLAIAFHPDFESNKQVFLSYTITADDGINKLVSRITRLTENTVNDALDPDSENIILQQNQFATNHNGGYLAFGSDSHLYIGFGDGGGGGDPQEQAQNTQTLLGSLLRINVNDTPYTIPTDNPFAGGGGLPEIYAYGLRNPWRWSFDRETNELWLADVGQNEREEVNQIVKGGNYGWDCFEGNRSFEIDNCPPTNQLISPVAEYDHSEGFSVTGGYVYRGNTIPELQGIYLFGDFGSGTIWGLFPNGENDFERRVLVNSQLSIVSFAQANDGELFVVDYSGAMYRIIDASNK